MLRPSAFPLITVIKQSNAGLSAEGPPPERRLSAVLFADMVNYSSLRQEDALQFRQEMLTAARALLVQHDGRFVKSLGDGFLAEFKTASHAVSFGMELQEALARRNAEADPKKRFRLRMGVHAGEVVVLEGEDLGGTTVNMAARAEPLAAPGGLCLTEEVWQEVQENLPRPAQRLGRVRVKGMRRDAVFYHVAPLASGWLDAARHRCRLWWRGRAAQASLALIAFFMALSFWLRPSLGALINHWLPASPEQRVQRAATLLQRFDLPGHLNQAIDELRQALRLEPKWMEAHSQLGLAYWRRYKLTTDFSDRSEAWAASSNALACNRDSKLGHFVQGLVAMDEKRTQDAVTSLTQANDAARWEEGEILIELAAACLAAGEVERATDYAGKADRASVKPWYYFNSRGRFGFARGRAAEALGAFRNAVQAAPDSPIAWANLGFVLESFGEHAEAKSCFEKSLNLAPGAGAYDGMGTHFLAESNWLAAATHFDAAARLSPARYDLPGKAGLALLHEPSRRAQANQLLSLAMDKAKSRLAGSSDLRAQSNCGLYLAALGQTEECQRAFTALLREHPRHPTILENIQAASDILHYLGSTNDAERIRKLLDLAEDKSR